MYCSKGLFNQRFVGHGFGCHLFSEFPLSNILMLTSNGEAEKRRGLSAKLHFGLNVHAWNVFKMVNAWTYFCFMLEACSVFVVSRFDWSTINKLLAAIDPDGNDVHKRDNTCLTRMADEATQAT